MFLADGPPTLAALVRNMHAPGGVVRARGLPSAALLTGLCTLAVLVLRPSDRWLN